MSNIIVNGKTSGNIVVTPGSSQGEVTIRGSGSRYPPYEGEYEAEALLEEDQTFQTKGTVMKDNMVFKGMKVRIVHNPAGGLTYYVGE